MKKQNTISAHVIQFARFLRKHQFNCGPIEEKQALEALTIIPYSKAQFFKNALKTTLVKNKHQLDLFDGLYLKYWAEISKAENSKQKELAEEKQVPKEPASGPSIQVLRKWLQGNHDHEKIEIPSHDTAELFTEQDFSSFSQDHVAEALRQTKALTRKLSNRKGQRFLSTKNRKTLDLRKVMRRNIGQSEEIIHLQFKNRKIEKLKLVLICDVSRSMELYSKFLIQFMFGLNQAATKIETFVFSTRLARITNSLKDNDFNRVLTNLKYSFEGWSGGTKIGSTLWEFGKNYSTQLIDQKTKVIILSDGWDTGESDLVGEALQLIQRKAQRVIWLNPLAGNPSFSPDTACLKAALPYVDDFQAASSISDLKRLIRVL